MMMKCSLFGTFWDQVLVAGGSKNISLQANIFLSVWECNLLCVFQLNHTVLLVKLCRMNINFWIICLFSVIYYITQTSKYLLITGFCIPWWNGSLWPGENSWKSCPCKRSRCIRILCSVEAYLVLLMQFFYIPSVTSKVASGLNDHCDCDIDRRQRLLWSHTWHNQLLQSKDLWAHW